MAVLHVVAHQGGWDELVMVVLPLVALFGVLVVANRRAKRDVAGAAKPTDE